MPVPMTQPLPQSKPTRSAGWRWLLVGAVVLLQACSAARLAYWQAPLLGQWRADSYLDLSASQTRRVRAELDAVHQWHRATLLPQHLALLRQTRLELSGPLSVDQACTRYALALTSLQPLNEKLLPTLVWLARELSDAQLQHLEGALARSNSDWRRERLSPPLHERQSARYEQLLSRTEMIYGRVDETQKAVMRMTIARSAVDAEKMYAERLRRQQDLLSTLREVRARQANPEQAMVSLRALLQRLTVGGVPVAAGQPQVVGDTATDGCATFALVHNSTTAQQRLQAQQRLAAYEDEFEAMVIPAIAAL